MIPVEDSTRRPLHAPIMTQIIIGMSTLVFILELWGGEAFILRWAFVPADLMTPHGLVTLFTTIFLHAGWVHFLGNMLFFWVFAPQVEDVMGPASFLAFYLLGGVVAALTLVLVAAVMGAFLATYPSDRIRTAFVLAWSVKVTFLPAVAMVGAWFAAQVFNKIGAFAQVQTDGSVMYLAYVGAFVYGTLACRLFESRRRGRLQRLEAE
jgi:membrane associated rhomboid family serine protease